jgi:hypothetical protein
MTRVDYQQLGRVSPAKLPHEGWLGEIGSARYSSRGVGVEGPEAMQACLAEKCARSVAGALTFRRAVVVGRIDIFQSNYTKDHSGASPCLMECSPWRGSADLLSFRNRAIVWSGLAVGYPDCDAGSAAARHEGGEGHACNTHSTTSTATRAFGGVALRFCHLDMDVDSAAPIRRARVEWLPDRA